MRLPLVSAFLAILAGSASFFFATNAEGSTFLGTWFAVASGFLGVGFLALACVSAGRITYLAVTADDKEEAEANRLEAVKLKQLATPIEEVRY